MAVETPDQETNEAVAELAIPIVWLLGKTGAGKSSLIRLLTGLSEIEVGNGFAPCTRASEQFDFPADAPLLRFLDTRGLGEAGYDPAEDLDVCSGHSHAVIALCRLDDPVQGEVGEALGAALRLQPKLPVLLVHTGADLLPDDGTRSRALHANAALMERAAGRSLRQVAVSLHPGEAGADATRDLLVDELLEILPAAGLLLARSQAATDEQRAFAELRRRVLFYSGIAGVSDMAPLVGLVSVPAVQTAMLRELGQRYEVTWSRGVMGRFLGALGVGFLARLGAGFGLRQVAKLLPVVGQTLGAGAAGSVSFATTYALGRAAAMYLYHQSTGGRLSKEDLRRAYRDALRSATNAPEN